MTEPKHYTMEKLSEYIDSEIEAIQREKADPKNWKLNQSHASQIMVRTDMEEGA